MKEADRPRNISGWRNPEAVADTLKDLRLDAQLIFLRQYRKGLRDRVNDAKSTGDREFSEMLRSDIPLLEAFINNLDTTWNTVRKKQHIHS